MNKYVIEFREAVQRLLREDNISIEKDKQIVDDAIALFNSYLDELAKQNKVIEKGKFPANTTDAGIIDALVYISFLIEDQNEKERLKQAITSRSHSLWDEILNNLDILNRTDELKSSLIRDTSNIYKHKILDKYNT